MSNFGETLDLDQIEGAEFEFLGPEMRFERNKTKQILKFETKVWSDSEIEILGWSNLIKLPKTHPPPLLEILTVGSPRDTKNVPFRFPGPYFIKNLSKMRSQGFHQYMKK